MRDEVIRGLKMKRNEDEDIRGYLNFLHIILLLKYNYKIMNSNEINIIARNLKINSFLGVFAADELVNVQGFQKGVLICNTKPSNQLGEHWIGICLGKSSIIYYDSLNGSFHKSQFIRKFLKKMKKNLLRNDFQIQTNTSERCGLHSLVFCYVLSKNNNERTFKRFLQSFVSHKLHERENLSLKYFLSVV